MIDNLFAQIMGFVALLFLIISYQSNKRDKIILFRSFHNFSYGIHYYLMGSPTAGLVQIIAVVRNFFFKHRSKNKYLDHYFSLLIWIVIFVVIAIFSWKGLISLLAVIGIILGTLGIWVKNTQLIRILSLMSILIWLVHNTIIFSYAGIISAGVGASSIIIAMIRFDLKFYLKFLKIKK
jgi:hypothetical protein